MFKEGQEVQIVAVEELVRLKNKEDIDIVFLMFQYGGYKTKIARVLPKEEWAHSDIPEYILDVDSGVWIWYDETLKLIE